MPNLNQENLVFDQENFQVQSDAADLLKKYQLAPARQGENQDIIPLEVPQKYFTEQNKLKPHPITGELFA